MLVHPSRESVDAGTQLGPLSVDASTQLGPLGVDASSLSLDASSLRVDASTQLGTLGVDASVEPSPESFDPGAQVVEAAERAEDGQREEPDRRQATASMSAG
jgi:hypothetical protein